jgi:3-carboxy-cis,cis-muconate cycloisomerase
MGLLDPLFGAEAIDQIFADSSCVQRMLDFEAALARAEAKLGVIPQTAAVPIETKCRAELLDLKKLATDAGRAGNLAIPLVKQLTALVQKEDAEAARYVHWGATSQDVIDTALVLQLRDAFAWMENRVGEICDRLATLCEQHRSTVMAGRTWMQQAVPIVFGLKTALWLDAMVRHRARLRETRKRALVLQFGGAAGTLASLGTRGIEVGNALGEELHLEFPAAPWHTNRDRVVEIATTLESLTGTLGKIARDISLMMQTEVDEVSEPFGEGRGGSSTMPQKRNPVACAAVLAAAQRVQGLTITMMAAMSQEHERGLGGWHAEWETLPEIARLCGGALRWISETVDGLEVHREQMLENIESFHGLIYSEAVSTALAKKLGKSAAHEIVANAARQAFEDKKHLREALSADPKVNSQLSAKEIGELFDPQQHLGVAQQFIDRVIAASRLDRGEDK